MSAKAFTAKAVTSNPAAESHRLIDFETVEVVSGIVTDTYFLVVSGETPCINMKVLLAPKIYADCPEFWEIEVVGYLPQGICLTAMGRFHESLLLSGVVGTRGIEVIGATKREQREVPGGCRVGETFSARQGA